MRMLKIDDKLRSFLGKEFDEWIVSDYRCEPHRHRLILSNYVESDRQVIFAAGNLSIATMTNKIWENVLIWEREKAYKIGKKEVQDNIKKALGLKTE